MTQFIGTVDPTTHRLLEEIQGKDEEHAEDLLTLLSKTLCFPAASVGAAPPTASQPASGLKPSTPRTYSPSCDVGLSSQELGNNPVLAIPWPRYSYIISAMREAHEDMREATMKIPTVKYQSGLEVSLAAFLLKMTSLDIGQSRRRSINRKSPGVSYAGNPSTHNLKEEQHERRSF